VVLAVAAEVLGADRLRACFFALVDGRPPRLVPAGFHGRAEAPRTTFVGGTSLGEHAIELITRREDLFCPDARADPPPGWQPGGHAYRTFIAVPVTTEARAFGIMTIDGLQVGDLTEADVSAVRVFARLLASPSTRDWGGTLNRWTAPRATETRPSGRGWRGCCRTPCPTSPMPAGRPAPRPGGSSPPSSPPEACIPLAEPTSTLAPPAQMCR
jgi:hypothetical protein